MIHTNDGGGRKWTLSPSNMKLIEESVVQYIELFFYYRCLTITVILRDIIVVYRHYAPYHWQLARNYWTTSFPFIFNNKPIQSYYPSTHILIIIVVEMKTYFLPIITNKIIKR